jgi:ribosome-associated translation inhibitor RaiA
MAQQKAPAPLKFNAAAAVVSKAVRTRESTVRPDTEYETEMYAYLATNPTPAQRLAGQENGVLVTIEGVELASLSTPEDVQKAVDKAMAKLRRKVPGLTVRAPLLSEVGEVGGLLSFPVETAFKITRERVRFTAE